MALIVLAACSKDQKCVNWLEGEWDVTKMEATDSNGTTTDLMAALAALGGTITGTMEFTKYSVKNDENGAATFITTTSILGQSQSDTINFDYKNQDDCETVWLKEAGSSSSEILTIEEASKSKMVISGYDETEKATTRITIEKK